VANSEQQKHDSLAERVSARLGARVLETDRSYGDLVFVVEKAAVHEVLSYLKNDEKFDLLLDIAGVDCVKLPEYRERFELEYILYATGKDHRVRVRVPVPEFALDVPTATDLWRAANWAEREAHEMFGFVFTGHPCLKRLITHQQFEGHPLRKDYPVMQGQWCATTSSLEEELEE